MFASLRIGAFTAALLVVSLGSLASAQDQGTSPAPDLYQRHLDRGLAEYEAGRYESAAEAFQAAYAVRAEPDLQYNAARSFERAVKREEALAAYELFLGLPGTTSDTRNRALQSVASLRAEIQAINAAAEPAPADAPDPVEPPAINNNNNTVAAQTPRSRRGGKSTAGWVLIGTGAVSLIAGGVFGGLAVASNNEFEDATLRTERIELAEEVNNNALTADVLLGVGLVFAVVGIVLVVTDGGNDEDAERAQVRLTPAAGPTSVGFMLSGRL